MLDRISPIADPDELEPGFVRMKLTTSGYRGNPKGVTIAVYETEAVKMVENSVGERVIPLAPPEEKKKEVDGPPADKSVKRHNVKTK